MTQVWFPRKNLASAAQSAGQFLLEDGGIALAALSNNRWLRRWGPWAGGSFLVSFYWATEWRLILATGLGIAATKLVYWLLTHRQQLSTWQWRRSLNTPQGQLLLASGGGGITALGIYMATMVWSEVDNPWLATGIIIQGIGSLATVGLLLWQRGKTPTSPWYPPVNSDFDHCLQMLAHGDRLQRLLTLRQLRQWQDQGKLTALENQELADYLWVLLDLETDAPLQRAVLAILQPPVGSGRSMPRLTIPQRQRQVID